MTYKRNWEIQYEPKGALRATVLRYLTIGAKGISFTKLHRSVFDDLAAIVFWDRCDPPERGRPKVFCHGMGSSYMETRRKNVGEDLRAALESLIEEGVVKVDPKKRWVLTSYEARALWLAKMPKNVLTVYNSLRSTAPGTEHWRAGMDIFERDGTLKDKQEETIRQQKLEIEQLKERLKDAHLHLKIYRESEEKKHERRKRAGV